MGAVRFSSNSKKLAVKSDWGTCLEVWDVQSPKLDVRLGEIRSMHVVSFSPVLWTNNNQNVIAAFEFTADSESELGVYDTAKTTYRLRV